ncbi:hypothetical protein NHX12_033167 [Muraenolepis orangiensis]|uniref:Peptidase A2 domain-containing protein n=1 Tax=Muraenolepis orangiensis TaxID=630683 RepID=A0A9Q0E370_9TELE|nr:hypothetical protein NHX12_033167 [Muraenolepis orangiensis]
MCYARLLLADGSHSIATFKDSGADVNIIDEILALQLGISHVPLSCPILANALDGHLLGTVSHQTTPVSMLISESQLGALEEVGLIKTKCLANIDKEAVEVMALKGSYTLCLGS